MTKSKSKSKSKKTTTRKKSVATQPTIPDPTIPDPTSFTQEEEAPQAAAIPEPEPEFVKEWDYKTPLENPPDGVMLNARVIEINGMKWQARTDCEYEHDYYYVYDKIQEVNKFTPAQRKANPLWNEPKIFRTLMEEDLFFIVYFIMKNPLANHPFIVESCKEVQRQEGDTLQVWARDHLKTTIISTARPTQKILCNPEVTIGIISATRPLAVKIQSTIKKILEDPIVIRSFPDVLYTNAKTEADKWSEAPEGGLIVKRKGFMKEPTVSSWGLVDGMPTGYHFSDIICDDIVTQTTCSPEVQVKVKENLDMIENLRSRAGTQITIVGTFYTHDDALVYASNQKDPETDEPYFPLIKKPALHDGTSEGRPVFESLKSLKRKMSKNLQMFYRQQLCNPTPLESRKLSPGNLVFYSKNNIPNRLYKFMIIDGAGDKGKRVDRAADAWAMMVIGVEPYRDELGASRIFILDLLIKEMDLKEAQEAAVAMYARNGMILKLGIEKVGMSTTEIHICNALRVKKKFLSVQRGNLEILKPSGRTKAFRIESALSWPLDNGKIGVLDTVDNDSLTRLKTEMEKFPAWHDDGLDGLSYVYDMIKEYRFGARPIEEEPKSMYDLAFEKAKKNKNSGGWIAV